MDTCNHRFGWMGVALAVLVALALVLAPVAGLHAMPCHGHSDHGRTGAGLIQAPSSAPGASESKLRPLAPMNCCSLACGFCSMLADIERGETPAAIGSSLRFAWVAQTGSGLAPPPTLGPPRLPV